MGICNRQGRPTQTSSTLPKYGTEIRARASRDSPLRHNKIHNEKTLMPPARIGLWFFCFQGGSA
jgi:hypothetical protein